MSPEEIFFKVSKLQRTLIVAAVCILLLVGFYLLFISDMLLAINGLEQQIKSLELEIRNQERILAEGPRLKGRITELKKELEAMVASLPEKQDIEELLKKITDLLSETNLAASQFVPGKEVINEELYYAKIPIQLSVRGDYQHEGMFLTALNSLPRVVNVPSVTLSKSGGALTSREKDMAKRLEVVTLDARITGETYRRLSPEEIKVIAEKKAGKPAAKPAGGRPAPAPAPAAAKAAGGPPKMGP
jgi:type IV pilus assembly protein PilO